MNKMESDSFFRRFLSPKNFEFRAIVFVAMSCFVFSCSRNTPKMQSNRSVFQEPISKILTTQLCQVKADSGLVFLMDVKSGCLLSSIGFVRKGNGYVVPEKSQIDQKCELGNLFVPIAMLGALNTGKFSLNDSVDTKRGLYESSGTKILDSNYEHGGFGKITYQDAITKSSNIGVVRAMEEAFGESPELLSVQIEKMFKGEPFQSNQELKTWNWKYVSIGYEMKLSPLQILVLFNAIANNGKMIYNNKVINPAVAALPAIQAMKVTLKAVVTQGTGKFALSDSVSIAGKTGSMHVWKGHTESVETGEYYGASFCGYFPAENPEYSCLVIVFGAKEGVSYGGRIAAPIFKEIAENISRK
jgi:cell division protein FtsI (penicillin-binding protein 3)